MQISKRLSIATGMTASHWPISNSSRNVLWIDDRPGERDAAATMLGNTERVRLLVAADSDSARRMLEAETIHCVVTDIMRRSPSGVRINEGYDFFRTFIRPNWPTMPVIFHTKNLPWTFEVDTHSQYLSKWDPVELKKIELECRVCDSVRLFEAFVDHNRWLQIKPRLVEVHSTILERLSDYEDVWRMAPDAFEQLVAELLVKIGFQVLWVPSGRDGGIDIVAACRDTRFLIDVKRYRERPVGVELVRSIYGVATAAQLHESGVMRAGIITSSYFTSDALHFRQSSQPRILLQDGEWLRRQLSRYAPHMVTTE